MPFKANYEVFSDQPGRLTIRDVGPWTEHRTVTNDAEWVVKDLYARDLLADGKQLFYFDSAGVLSEIVHEGGVFKGFRPGRKS